VAASNPPGGAAPSRRSFGPSLVMALLVLAALLVAGESVRRTLARRYVERDPALALAWEPSDAAARENLANHRLAAAIADRSPTKRAAGLAGAAATARRALAAGPLHWAALRDVGIAADLSGDGARATAVMRRAAMRGRRDVATQGWWLQRALSAGDAPGAVSRLDAMLRSEPDLEPRLFPVMEALLSIPGARETWVRSLVAEPNWRKAAIDDFAFKDPDLDAVGQLFAALAARRSSPSDSELGVFLTRLAGVGRYADARAIWARSAGLTGSAIPYDGNFRGLAGPAPFNWRIAQPGSGVAAMETRPGVGSALSSSYPSSEAPTIAEQLLTLAPGAYRLGGRWRVEQPASGAAVSWTMTCANGAPIGEWRRGTDNRGDWAAFDFAFVVPSGCDGQWLRLVGRAGDGFGEVATAFTSLNIRPVAPTR
jgi:hypothetical protein